MALETGRNGYLGLALEAVSGTPESSPSTFLYCTENTMKEKHEPLANISSHASRVKNFDAVVGKKWGEGDVEVYVDCNQIGYLFKAAFGSEVKTVVSADVNDHHFILTASGNAPKSATLWNYRGAGVTVKQFAYSCVDTLELEVSTDDIAKAKVGFISGFPSAVSAPTLQPASGTLVTWKDMTIQFGDTIAAALAATATKVTNFKLTLANNTEAHYRSGSNTPDVIALGEAEISGEYMIFFEDDTELNKYRNLTKQAAVITLTGGGLPGGVSEQVKIFITRMFLEDSDPTTDLGDMFALTQKFQAIQGTTLNPGYVDIIVRNGKTSVY